MEIHGLGREPLDRLVIAFMRHVVVPLEVIALGRAPVSDSTR